MSVRRAAVSSVVVLGCLLGLGAFVPTGASAACVGPHLYVGSYPSRPAGQGADASPVPPSVSIGGDLVVAGEWFREGCDDTGPGGPGCGGPPPATPETPMRDVELLLEQDGDSWSLGTVDAAARSTHYAVEWHAVIPAGVVPGPATLRAGTAQLEITVIG